MSRDSGKVIAIVAAAGMGRRIGGYLPKQFLKIVDKPILVYTLEKLDRCKAIDEIVLAVAKEKMDLTETILKQWKMRKTVRVVPGGAEREDSIRHALDALPENTEWVAVHDGARPFVSIEKIEEVVQAGQDFGAAILAVSEKNTVKKAKEMWVEKTLVRNEIWEVQTPQVFKSEWLKSSYADALKSGYHSTDDAALVERMGHRIRIVEGEETNIKITSLTDLIIARTFVENGY